MRCFIPPLPAAVGDTLQALYSFRCPLCNCAHKARPSLMMIHNLNRGGGRCLECKTLLHLKIADDGTRMEAEAYQDDLEPFVGEDYAS